MLQAVADSALQKSLSHYAMRAQLKCQHFCETKSVEAVQELADQNAKNLTSESVDAIEETCNKMCLRKHLRAFHLQHRVLNEPVDSPQSAQQQPSSAPSMQAPTQQQ